MKREEWSAHDVNAYFNRLAAAQRRAEQNLEDIERSDEGLMTRREVAEYLAVSVRTIQRMEAREQLTRVDVPGVRGARYRRTEVEELLEQKTSRPWTGDRPRWG